jgi:hypothetical protein
MTAELYDGKAEKSNALIRWLREFVVLPKDSQVQTLIEKGDEYAYVSVTPALPSTRVRLWFNIQDISYAIPRRIDVLRDQLFDISQLKPMVEELAAAELSREVALARLPITKQLVETLPFDERVGRLGWILRGFSVRRDCHLIEILFEAKGPYSPLLMRVSLGRKGFQGSIEGIRLESPSVLFGPKSKSDPYAPGPD